MSTPAAYAAFLEETRAALFDIVTTRRGDSSAVVETMRLTWRAVRADGLLDAVRALLRPPPPLAGEPTLNEALCLMLCTIEDRPGVMGRKLVTALDGRVCEGQAGEVWAWLRA